MIDRSVRTRSADRVETEGHVEVSLPATGHITARRHTGTRIIIILVLDIVQSASQKVICDNA